VADAAHLPRDRRKQNLERQELDYSAFVRFVQTVGLPYSVDFQLLKYVEGSNGACCVS
jgi:hypothetical protein